MNGAAPRLPLPPLAPPQPTPPQVLAPQPFHPHTDVEWLIKEKHRLEREVVVLKIEYNRLYKLVQERRAVHIDMLMFDLVNRGVGERKKDITKHRETLALLRRMNAQYAQ